MLACTNGVQTTPTLIFNHIHSKESDTLNIYDSTIFLTKTIAKRLLGITHKSLLLDVQRQQVIALRSTPDKCCHVTFKVSLAGAATGIIFVAPNVLSRQTRFCRAKNVFVATNIVVVATKAVFVATKVV